MTPDEIAAERERFLETWCARELNMLNMPEYQGWYKRAEIAHAEYVELRAEIERLRERVRELERENRKLNGEGMDSLDYWSA